MPKDTETGSGRVHSCYGLRRTRWRWIGRTSTLGDAIRTHSGLFTKLRDMTATRCDTPCMTSHTQANSLNGDIRNRGPIFLQTWKARSNALNPIVEATLRVQLPAISRDGYDLGQDTPKTLKRASESDFASARRPPMCRNRSFQGTGRDAPIFAPCHGRARPCPHLRSR